MTPKDVVTEMSSAREASCHLDFMGTARLLVTRVTLIYQLDEFFFLFII